MGGRGLGGFIEKVRSESGLLTCCCTLCSLTVQGPLFHMSGPSAGRRQKKWIYVKHGQANSYFSKLIFVRKAQLCSGKRTRGNAAGRCVMSGFSQYPLPGYKSLDKILEEFYSIHKAQKRNLQTCSKWDYKVCQGPACGILSGHPHQAFS